MRDKIEYTINNKPFTVRIKDFSGSQGINTYQKNLITALGNVGVSPEYVNIEYGGNSHLGNSFARVTWEINKQKYRFECNVFHTMQKNLGALCGAIQDDVRHITRGIKPLFAAMRQYEALPSPEEMAASNGYFSLEIKELRNMMKLYHPDGSSPNKEKYGKLREAYESKKQTGV